MNSSRRKMAAILDALGVPPSARRPAAPPASPACESLEGRQLLAGGLGFGMGVAGMGMGGPADFSSMGGGFASTGAGQVTAQGSSSMPTDFQGGRFGSLAFGPGGQQGFNVNSQGTPANSGGVGQATMFPGQVSGTAMQATSSGGWAGVPSATGGAAWGGPDVGAFSGRFRQGGGSVGGQGLMVPGQGGAVGSGSSADNSQLQTDLQKIRTDEQAIHDKSQVTPAMQATVRNDIKAIKGAETTTPDQTAVTTLQNDIKTAQTNTGGPTAAQIAQIQTDQDAIYKSQGVSAGLITQLDTDQQAIKTAAGVTDTDRATIATDKAAIEADFAKLKPTIMTAAMPVATPAMPPVATTGATTAIDPSATTPPTTTTAPAAATPSTTDASVTTPIASTPVAPPTTPVATSTTSTTSTPTPTAPSPTSTMLKPFSNSRTVSHMTTIVRHGHGGQSVRAAHGRRG